MARKCKHTFRTSCEGLEGRQLLSTAGGAVTLPMSPPLLFSQKLQASFTIRPSGKPDYPYGAIIEGLQPGSPLAKVALAGGAMLSLQPGDEIVSLGHVPINANGSNLENHYGPTPIDFVRQGSNVVLNGTINI